MKTGTIELSKAEFVALLMEHGKTVVGAHREDGLIDTDLETSLHSAGIQTSIIDAMMSELNFSIDDQLELAEKIKIMREID